MPLVSIIIPVFQSAATVAKAIRSALNQSFKDFEIIVVDDGSTDNLDRVIEQFGNQIVYLKQNNQGAAAARNHGIENASGQIVAFLDADDIWLPEKLTLQIPRFGLDPEVGVVFGNVLFLNEGRVQKKTYFDILPPSRGEIFTELFAYDFVPMLSALVRRPILDQVGFFDVATRYVEDYELWLKIAKHWKFDYLQDPVAIYRISPSQTSKNYTQAAAALLKLKKEIYWSDPEKLASADKAIVERGLYDKFLKLALCYMREGNKEGAAQTLVDYKKIRGFSIKYFIFRVVFIFPTQIMMFIVRIWDRFYQKPTIGFV